MNFSQDWLSGLRTMWSHPDHRRRQRKDVAAAVECCEDRALLAATAVLTGTTLTVNDADATDNVITVTQAAGKISITDMDGDVDITVNGTPVADVNVSLVRRLIVNGLDGNDELKTVGVKLANPTTLNGGAGDDTLGGTLGNHIINGGDGDDQLDAATKATGRSDLVLIANYQDRGFDRLAITALNSYANITGVEKAKLTGGAGINYINANEYHGSVTIEGGAGNDTIYGGNEADDLDGGAGNDRIIGGRGSDMLKGGDGNDRLNGGAGDDDLDGGDGTDTMVGGLGDDTLDGTPEPPDTLIA